MPFSSKEAIKRWEQKTGQSPADVTELVLTCQLPTPIDRLDDSLNMFENIEKLSLSTNAIERMVALPKLKNLKILSLGRNNIRRFQGLEDIGQTLQELWISYNQIEKLDLQPCVQLHTLLMSNNRIKTWDEFAKLQTLQNIKTVLFIGNPVYAGLEKDEAIPKVVKKIPQIETVDSKLITAAIRQAAEECE